MPADLGSELAKVLPQADLIGALSMLVEQLFANEEQGIVEVHSGADLLDESDISFSQRGVVYPGNVATFRYNEEFFGRVAKVRSQLYLYPMVARQWMVKYRVTYPDGVDSESQVNAFMAALPWTIRGFENREGLAMTTRRTVLKGLAAASAEVRDVGAAAAMPHHAARANCRR